MTLIKHVGAPKIRSKWKKRIRSKNKRRPQKSYVLSVLQEKEKPVKSKKRIWLIMEFEHGFSVWEAGHNTWKTKEEIKSSNGVQVPSFNGGWKIESPLLGWRTKWNRGIIANGDKGLRGFEKPKDIELRWRWR